MRPRVQRHLTLTTLHLIALLVCLPGLLWAARPGDPMLVTATTPPATQVRTAATTNITISAPGATIQGLTMVAGDRVLLTAQTAAAANGLYVWQGAASAMTRAPDADIALAFIAGQVIAVVEAQGDAPLYVFVTPQPIILGTTALTYQPIQSALALADMPGGFPSIDEGTGEISGAFLPYPQVLTAAPGPAQACLDARHTMVWLNPTTQEVRGWWCPDGAGSNPLELAGRPGINQLIDGVGGSRTIGFDDPDGTLTFANGTGLACVVSGTAPAVTMTCGLVAASATAALTAMVGDSGAGGTKGLVPAPAAGDAAAGKFLKADGTWVSASGSVYAFGDMNVTGVTCAVAGATRYHGLAAAAKTTDAVTQVPWPTAGTFRNARSYVAVAAASTSLVSILRINGVDTALAVSSSGTGAISGGPDTSIVSVAAGDLVNVSTACSGTDTGFSNFALTVEFRPN